MKMPRWFRGGGRRHDAAGDAEADQAVPGATEDGNESSPAARAPMVTRLTADAFAWRFLEWT